MTWLKTILLMAMVVLSGCSVEDRRPLKVATNLWPGYEPLYLAQYLGEYDRQVTVIQLASATEVMRAMAHGKVDAAALTLDETIALMAKGLDVVVLRALDYSRGGDAVVAAEGAESLQGLRVGVENTALGAIVLSEALQQANLEFGDITVMNMSPDEQERAMEDGKVDAVVTFEPIKTRLLAEGGTVLFDTRQAPDLVVDVLVARRSVVEQRPKQVKQLLHGYLKAREHMQSHQSEADAFFCKRLQLEADELEEAFGGIYLPTQDDNRRWFGGSPSAYQKTFTRVLGIMQDRNLVSGDPVPANPPDWVLEVSI